MIRNRLTASFLLSVVLLFGVLRIGHLSLCKHEAQSICHPHHQKHIHNFPNECAVCHFTLSVFESPVQSNLMLLAVMHPLDRIEIPVQQYEFTGLCRAAQRAPPENLV